jgi:hypothetical protein
MSVGWGLFLGAVQDAELALALEISMAEAGAASETPAAPEAGEGTSQVGSARSVGLFLGSVSS